MESEIDTKNAIQSLWAKYAPYWHVCAAIIVAIIYISTFVGLPERVAALENHMEKVDLLSQRVDDIANFMGVPKREEKK